MKQIYLIVLVITSLLLLSFIKKEKEFNIDNQNDPTYKIDSINRIYSNYKYGVSFKYPKKWKIDNGTVKGTIFRTYQRDSTLTFAISALETNMSKEDKVLINNNIWLLTDEKNEKKKYESSINSPIKDFKVEKTYLRNVKAKKTSFSNLTNDITGSYICQNIFVQIIIDGTFYNFLFTAPKELYLNNSVYYDDLFSHIQLSPKD